MPRCRDKGEVPGLCRECLIDDDKRCERVPASDLVVIELVTALTDGLYALSAMSYQTTVAAPEWRDGYLAMVAAQKKYLKLAHTLRERAFPEG